MALTQVERVYSDLVDKVLSEGYVRKTRNAETISIFGESIEFKAEFNEMPLLQGRKIFHKGVLGEFAALVRQPTHKDDFEAWGCNYWEKWCKPDGSIRVDYGNEWFKHGQIDHLKECLRNNPTDRRMIVTGWNPANLPELDLPCCHHTYQFYVQGDELSMTWAQRSVDTMIGLPADILLAWAWLCSLCIEFGYKPGKIKMDLGDVHIYKSHKENAIRYLVRCDQIDESPSAEYPVARWLTEPGTPFENFNPLDVRLEAYNHLGKLEFELYA